LIVVLSGTGSCCFGRESRGATVKVGGWGERLGDRGSAYDIARRAIERVLQIYDWTGRWPVLGQGLLRAVLLNEPDELVVWFQGAAKHEIAALAVEVFAAAAARDRVAREIVGLAAIALAQDAASCARRLLAARQQPTFVLTGGTLLQQEAYATRVRQALRRQFSRAGFTRLRRESAWGAVILAGDLLRQMGTPPRQQTSGLSRQEIDDNRSLPIALNELASSPTEQRNPRSQHLDRLPLREAVRLFLAEETRITAALAGETDALARVCAMIAGALRSKGRLFYVGAGTSGRLGVLDASECPPTFGTEADQVQGIMAGGCRALWEAVEGAEDDYDGGVRAIHHRGVRVRDVVIGIAASGRTPFVWGALNEARRRGAKTVLLCFNPALKKLRSPRPDIVLAISVGPELLTGSTRLKAGSATKLVLNIFSTLAMVKLGKVVENLMVDLRPSNSKLRDRAVRMFCELTDASAAIAEGVLRQSNWNLRQALKAHRRRPRWDRERRRA
jgi:N-acetylmuramic acid 6-phosphate etherase